MTFSFSKPAFLPSSKGGAAKKVPRLFYNNKYFGHSSAHGAVQIPTVGIRAREGSSKNLLLGISAVIRIYPMIFRRGQIAGRLDMQRWFVLDDGEMCGVCGEGESC